MSSDFLRLRVRARLEFYESVLRQNRPLLTDLERLLGETDDDAMRDYIRAAANPKRLKRAVDHARLSFKVGKLDEAATKLEQIDHMFAYLGQRLRRRYLQTGKKLLDRPHRGGTKKGLKAARNIEMAKEFRRRKSKRNSGKSDTALKEEIGRKMAALSRTAAIEAIDDGLERLKKSSG